MAIKDGTRSADTIALIERTLRSINVADMIPQPLPRRARRAPQRAPRSLRSAVRALLGHDASDRRLKLVFGRLGEAMLEGIVVMGAAGEIVYANENLCRMLGRTRAELVGRPAVEYFGSIGAPARSARPCERCETELRTKAGRAVVVEVCSERIEASDGQFVGALAVMIDVTAKANALRQSESEVRLLSAQFMAAQELERQRIASELHDGVGQALGGFKFALEGCETQIARGCTDTAVRTLRELTSRIQGVMDEVRRVAMNLRPSTLDDLGILPTLGWFVREFKAIYAQVEVQTLVEVREEDIALPLKTAIYRIVQEAFNNVVTHSGARRVTLSLRRTGRQLELQVQDDGAGLEAGGRSARRRGGLGLATMRERAEVTGGRFGLRSEKGRGTTVSVAWPVYQAREKG